MSKKKESNVLEPVLFKGDALKAAKEESVKIARPSDEEINEEINRLQALEQRLLKVELSQKANLQHAIAQLKHMKIDRTYARVSTKVLFWRNPEGWPKIAFFGMDSETCSISGENSNRVVLAPDLGPLNVCYNDIWQKLRGMGNGGSTYAAIHATFPGIIPDKVRDTIASHLPKFNNKGETVPSSSPFERILILTEAPEWKVSFKMTPQNLDPLVVGQVGDSLWLIDSFDLTPAERLIKAEWTTGPERP